MVHHVFFVVDQKKINHKEYKEIHNTDVRMTILRQFLVLQVLMLWQGGFLFYAAIVVPAGTEELGAFAQGRVTRHVTEAMNLIGVISLVALAGDQWRTLGCRRWRWALWVLMALTVAALWFTHPRIESHIDFAEGRIGDYPGFYFWHRVYLYVSMVQWVAGLGYMVVMLRAWSATPRAA